MTIDEQTVTHFLAVIIGVLWSVLAYLAKRVLAAMDKKLDASYEGMAKTNEELKGMTQRLESRLDHAMDDMEKTFAARMRDLEARFERQADGTGAEIEQRMERHSRTCSALFATRQEFGAFVASMNHKVDAVYDLLSRKGTTVR